MPTPKDYDLPEDFAVQLQPIAVMRSPLRYHHDAPRQPPCGDQTVQGFIVVRQGLQNALKDLGGFSHLWVLFWCHHSHGWNHQVVPPRDSRKRGLFATRAPHRPNPIGLSVLPLLEVRRRVLRVGPHDLLDGTPILDLKPYVPYCDSIPGAAAGWVAGLGLGGPDHNPPVPGRNNRS